MLRAAWNELHVRFLALGLFLSVVLACGVLVGLDIWRTLEDRGSEIAENAAETTNLARSMSQYAHDTMQGVDAVVVAVREAAELEGVSPRTTPRLQQLLRIQAATLSAVHGLFVFDADGANVVDSMSATHLALNAGDRSYFRHHRDHDDRGVLVGGPIRGRIDGAWVVTVSRRMNRADGGFAGVVLATVSVDTLRQFYGSFDMNRGGAVVLMTAEGTVVASTPDDRPGAGASIARGDFFSRVLPRAPSGSSEFVGMSDGRARLGSYQRVAEFPLVVMVSHGRDEVLAAWRSHALVHLGVTLVVALLLGLLGSCLALQVRHRLAAEARLREKERHYRMLADSGSDLVTQIGLDLRRTYVSPASRAMLGYEPSELVGMTPRDSIHPEDWPAVESALAAADADGSRSFSVSYRMYRRDGSIVWVEAIGRRMQGSEGYVMAMRDISKRKRVERDLHEANAKLQRLVMLDGLTGIGNRRSFDTTLEREFRAGARSELPLSLLLIDIDHFKRFNDDHGHTAGDECLRVIAATLSGQMKRPTDHPARYGGEEFAVLLPQTETGGAEVLAERICAAVRRLDLARQVPGQGHGAVGISVSIGIATIHPGQDGAAAQTLVEAADKALYAAKQGGRDRAVRADGGSVAGTQDRIGDAVMTA